MFSYVPIVLCMSMVSHLEAFRYDTLRKLNRNPVL